MAKNKYPEYKIGDKFRSLVGVWSTDGSVLELEEIYPPNRHYKEWRGEFIGTHTDGSQFSAGLAFDQVEKIPADTENPLLDIIEQISRLEVTSENVWIKATVLLMLDKLKEITQ
jgi:hypothetical protein